MRGFSRALGWSLCKGIPSLFNDTARTIWNPQFEIVCGDSNGIAVVVTFYSGKVVKTKIETRLVLTLEVPGLLR